MIREMLLCGWGLRRCGQSEMNKSLGGYQHSTCQRLQRTMLWHLGKNVFRRTFSEREWLGEDIDKLFSFSLPHVSNTVDPWLHGSSTCHPHPCSWKPASSFWLPTILTTKGLLLTRSLTGNAGGRQHTPVRYMYSTPPVFLSERERNWRKS